MEIVYTPRATSDLRSISAYLKPRSPQGAKRVRRALRRAIDLLADFPGIGAQQTVPGVFKTLPRKYPYLIYYTIDTEANAVVILTIRHTAQRREYEDA